MLTQISVYITIQQAERLAQEKNKSAVVRGALEDYFNKQEEEDEECAYCNREIPANKVNAPAEDDEEAWEALAKYHREWCEWITTRAHRRDA